MVLITSFNSYLILHDIHFLIYGPIKRYKDDKVGSASRQARFDSDFLPLCEHDGFLVSNSDTTFFVITDFHKQTTAYMLPTCFHDLKSHLKVKSFWPYDHMVLLQHLFFIKSSKLIASLG